MPNGGFIVLQWWLHNALPIRLNLMRRGIDVGLDCPRCGSDSESLTHLFLHCEWSHLIWFGSPLGAIPSLLGLDSFIDWFMAVIYSGHRDVVDNLAFNEFSYFPT